jgi:hypothetical protein
MDWAAGESGAWVFLSHSHRDLEKVRAIRDILERQGRNPLIFFLKCLEDDDARLPDLIREEIKARDWFIFCDSPHARASKWVQEENKLAVAQKSHNQIERVDLEKSLEEQLHKFNRLDKRATVFLSYARTDHEIADAITRALVAHDYRAWIPSESLSAGDNWQEKLLSSIEEAATRGFVLVLFTADSLKSKWCRREAEYALACAAKSQRSNVIPVIAGKFDSESLPYSLANLQVFDLTTGPLEDRIEALIKNLMAREME